MSSGISRTFNSFLNLARSGRFDEISNRLQERIFGRFTSIGFKRSLSVPHSAPAAKIPVRIRELEPADVSALFDCPPDADPAVVRDVVYRRRMKEAEIKTCFVAVTEDNIPCYMQWLISSDANSLIQSHFERRFPLLKPNEMLLEGAYVPPSFRGLKIMPAAMSLIAERAGHFGADTVITFVEHDNIPSLKGCQRAGFVPYLIRRDEWFGRPSLRRLRFIPLEKYDLTPALPAWLLPQKNVHENPMNATG